MSKKIDELGINDLKIVQDSDYFCFGTDSVLLANFAKSNSKNKNVLDLCSGVGVIPIIFSAKNSYSKIMAVELQKEMYELLEENVKINNLENSLNILNEDLRCVDKIREYIFKITKRNCVDIITVNPPYKPKGTGIVNEGRVKFIARHEDMCTLEDIFKVSSKLLENKGKLYIVHKPDRLCDLIAIARIYNLEAKKIRFVQPNINCSPSIVLIEYSKGRRK
ncbi:MAG: methyltransferase [Clostridia bacterium]|nr:methyltransferase [Clostridia bacterium]